MPKQNRALTEFLYENLKQNEYLRKLLKKLFIQYAYFTFDANWSLRGKEKADLLRFADLLSKTKILTDMLIVKIYR